MLLNVSGCSRVAVAGLGCINTSQGNAGLISADSLISALPFTPTYIRNLRAMNRRQYRSMESTTGPRSPVPGESIWIVALSIAIGGVEHIRIFPSPD
jgi:hypothetical protein